MRLFQAVLLLLALCPGVVSAQPPEPAKKISVLIVDGMNNHDWERGTRLMKGILERSGLFTVEVSTSPSNRDTASDEWKKWRPQFSKYAVVLNNFNGGYR